VWPSLDEGVLMADPLVVRALAFIKICFRERLWRTRRSGPDCRRAGTEFVTVAHALFA
jgi:hypothetical protein